MASISNPSAANPFIVKIHPGTYTVGGGLFMSPYVDLEGSGENNTIIETSVGGSGSGAFTIYGTNALRNLTIHNFGVGGSSIALSANSAASDWLTLENVTIKNTHTVDGDSTAIRVM